MQEINYSSLKRREDSKPGAVTLPIGAALIGLMTIVLIILPMLLLPGLMQSMDYVATVCIIILVPVFVLLIYRVFYDAQIKRDKLLRAFAKDNNFIFHSQKPIWWRDTTPEFTSSSSLLSSYRNIGRNLTARSDMALSGDYRGVHFTVTIVSMFWMRANKFGGAFYETIIINSEKLADLPHIIALSKLQDRIGNSLNERALKDPGWQTAIVDWQANAWYDIHIHSDGQNTDLKNSTISKMMADIHEVNKSDIEINDGALYIIKMDGIEYTQEGLRTIFDKVGVVARALAE